VIIGRVNRCSLPDAYITLTQGKNREIRRLCLGLGHEVTRLKRIKFGEFQLDDLEPGEFKELCDSEFFKMFPSALHR
jgi:pseudouridine synthase